MSIKKRKRSRNKKNEGRSVRNLRQVKGISTSKLEGTWGKIIYTESYISKKGNSQVVSNMGIKIPWCVRHIKME